VLGPAAGGAQPAGGGGAAAARVPRTRRRARPQGARRPRAFPPAPPARRSSRVAARAAAAAPRRRPGGPRRPGARRRAARASPRVCAGAWRRGRARRRRVRAPKGARGAHGRARACGPARRAPAARHGLRAAARAGAGLLQRPVRPWEDPVLRGRRPSRTWSATATCEALGRPARLREGRCLSGSWSAAATCEVLADPRGRVRAVTRTAARAGAGPLQRPGEVLGRRARGADGEATQEARRGRSLGCTMCTVAGCTPAGGAAERCTSAHSRPCAHAKRMATCDGPERCDERVARVGGRVHAACYGLGPQVRRSALP